MTDESSGASPLTGSTLLSIATVNVQSLGAKFNMFVDFLCEFGLDIISVTDCWIRSLSEHLQTELEACGMNIDILPRVKRKGGGVALVYNRHLEVNRIKHVTVH